MRETRGPDGDRRLWYDPAEIEQIAEDGLRRAGLTPSAAAPAANLEVLLEQSLGATLDQYAPLEPEVLGLTAFTAGRPPAVSINRSLTEAADAPTAPRWARGRWRATLAHEAAHILLHRHLFEPEFAQDALFAPGTTIQPRPDSSLLRCLHRDIGVGSRPADWKEVQANAGMASLLMPRRLFQRHAYRRISELSLTELTPGTADAATLAGDLAEAFEVSTQAAAIRLETTGVVVAGNQLPL